MIKYYRFAVGCGDSVLTTATTLLFLVTLAVSGTALAGTIYVGSAGTTNSIAAGNLNGTGTLTTLFDGTDGITGTYTIAIDVEGDTIYWTDSLSHSISSGAIDGSGAPTILFDSGDGLASPIALALDIAGGKMYWSDVVAHTIQVGNLDGSGAPTTLFDGVDGVDESYGIALDIDGGKIYWTDGGTNTINVGNLDGSGVPTILFTVGSLPPGALINATAYGLALDLTGNRIFWTDITHYLIQVGNLDGSGTPITLFDATDGLSPNLPAGISIDLAHDKVYWSEAFGNRIRIGNMDGSGSPTDLFNSADGVPFLAVSVALDFSTRVNIDTETDPLPDGGTTADFGNGDEPLPFTLTDSAVQVPAGSPDVVVTDPDGTNIVLPEYQVINFPDGTSNEVISIATPQEPVTPEALPDTETAIPVIREFGPSGTLFEPAITITVPYTDQDAAAVDDESSMIAYVFNTTTDVYEPIDPEFLSSIVVDTINNTLTFETDHFSIFGIGGPKAPPAPQRPWTSWVLCAGLAMTAAVSIFRRCRRA